MANGPTKFTSIQQEVWSIVEIFPSIFQNVHHLEKYLSMNTCNITSVLCSHSSFSTLWLRSKFIAERIHQPNCQWTKINEKFNSRSIYYHALDDGAFYLICTCDMERNSFRRCQHFECSDDEKKKLNSIWCTRMCTIANINSLRHSLEHSAADTFS